MAGTKRKSAADTKPTRRVSRRVEKAEVNYAESDAEGPASDSEFNEDVEESEHGEESEHEEEKEGSEEYDSDDSEVANKKDGWTKKGGKWQMVISLPKEKDDGGIPYEDERIHPNTLDFLKILKKNNKREWLKHHDRPFRQAEKDFHTFVEKVSEKVSEKDPTVPELPIKDVIFRIYRDIRFSPDKTPYKPYFSVAWSRTGRKGPYAVYYLHIQPGGGSFFGGGYYGCDNLTLACLREDIDQQPHQFKSVLMGDNFRRTFFPKTKNDEKNVIKAFCEMSKENALKKKPKGYDADHQDIELLKLRNFVVKKDISDAEITSENGINIVADIVEAMEPFITYLNNTVMP